MNEEQLRRVRQALQQARAQLADSGVSDEALGRLVPAGRRWMLPRRAHFVSLGRVWRVGILLISTADDRLYLLGVTTRAVQPGHHRNTAVAIEERREVQLLAWKGPFVEGDVVNYDTIEIDLAHDAIDTEANPLSVRDGVVMVQWDRGQSGAAPRPFADYLREQVALRIDPTS